MSPERMMCMIIVLCVVAVFLIVAFGVKQVGGRKVSLQSSAPTSNRRIICELCDLYESHKHSCPNSYSDLARIADAKAKYRVGYIAALSGKPLPELATDECVLGYEIGTERRNESIDDAPNI